jgi:hypothetical protein
MVDIAGEEHLPILAKFADESYNLRVEFVGFLPYEANGRSFGCEILHYEKWGLNNRVLSWTGLHCVQWIFSQIERSCF